MSLKINAKEIAMKKIVINPGCISCGLCEQIAPAVFEITDSAHVKAHINDDKEGILLQAYEHEILKAVAGCPVGVIKIVEAATTTR